MALFLVAFLSFALGFLVALCLGLIQMAIEVEDE